MCDFITRSSTLLFLEQFANTVVVDYAKVYFEIIEGYGEKGNILRSKLVRSLLRDGISICECNSQIYTCLLKGQFANTVFWKSALGYL